MRVGLRLRGGRTGSVPARRIPGIAFSLFFLVASTVPGFSASGFRTVTGPCEFRFPQDHAAHPGFKTEWWYYTGNVWTDEGRRFGYQLTFFRNQTAPSGVQSRWPEPASAWRSLQLYLGHLAVSDIRNADHRQAETMARGTLGMAGALRRGEMVRVFLKGWSAAMGAERHHLTAETPDLAVDLTLTPLKPPVFHGDGGYSPKGRQPGKASCYYSLTRLRTEGRIRIGAKWFAVSGRSWMDHEFSTTPLEAGITGWDWFSLQLDDGRDLMVYFLRESEGRIHPASSGTVVDREGEGAAIPSTEIRLETTAVWESPVTGASYPAGWTLSIPGRGLALAVSPVLADQEMQTPLTTAVTYWEGAVSVTGTSGGRPVRGTGYVELTGYEAAFDADM